MDNNMFNNGFNNYHNTSWSMPMMNSNIILVTSLEEAIMRTTRTPSDVVYFNQNGSEFYRVTLSNDGRKAYQTFIYDTPKQADNTPLVKGDLQEILARITVLEQKVLQEASNEQSV